MSLDTISLRETIHDGPHDEEYVYGKDYTLVFGAGEMDDPATYKAGIVTARIYPARENGYKATLSALWSFPRVEDPRETKIIESTEPIVLEQIELAASGMMAAIEASSSDEIEAVHTSFRQAALRSEG